MSSGKHPAVRVNNQPRGGLRTSGTLAGASLAALLVVGLVDHAPGQSTPTVKNTAGFDSPKYAPALPGLSETRRFIQLDEARKDFRVTGSGLCVAILDTGVRVSHADFHGKRIPARVNFGGPEYDVTDTVGNGTHVAGIIAANGLAYKMHEGIAPEVNLIPLKITSEGATTFEVMDRALGWVLTNHKKYTITVVNLGWADGHNYSGENEIVYTPAHRAIKAKIVALREARVAVVASAGNGYAKQNSDAAKRQGMGFPAILPETVSVGAVFDSAGGKTEYGEIRLQYSRPGQIMPFSQRLHETKDPKCRTDIFAPGAHLVSSGHLTDTGESIQSGTAKATAIVSGTILLMQEYHRRITGELPPVEKIEEWLIRGGVPIADDDQKAANVVPTGLRYVRLDALGALGAVRRSVQKDLLKDGRGRDK